MYYYIDVYVVSKCCAAAWQQRFTCASITKVIQLHDNKTVQVLVSQELCSCMAIKLHKS